MSDATSNLIVENGDAEMWCDRCGAEIPIGCDILTDKEVRVGLGCWKPQDGWQSAGSKLYHFFASERIALLESRDETTTGRLMTALEEAIIHQFDIVVSEDNEWFMEVLERIVQRVVNDTLFLSITEGASSERTDSGTE